MAKIISSIVKSNIFLLSNHTNTLIQSNLPLISSVRFLYAEKTLGLDGFKQTSEKIQQQFHNMSEKFRIKMSEYVSDNDKKSMIFTEDLKNMIHLAKSDDDVTLVTKMMIKFNQQNKEVRFGNFIFGPVVMRMFHILNKPDQALKCFNSKELEGFFDQLMSYQLLLDLLYENKKYDEIIKTFEVIKERQIQGTKYPRNIVVLTMAALYKQNTKESLDYALKLWQELHEVGHLPMRKATTFCAGLALNQGKPEVALEVISNAKKQNYMTVRCIKAAALSDLNRLEDTLPILRSIIDIDNPNNVKHTFTKDVIDRIEKAVKKQDNPTVTEEFKRIKKYFQEQGNISENQTLDSLLCADMESPAYISSQSNQRQPYKINPYRNRYEGQRSNQPNRIYNQRPGLNDLV